MPIKIDYSPAGTSIGAAAYEGGLGQFLQKQREMGQQQQMQEREIQARQQSQVYAAGQEAQNRYNQTLWDANNRDVMANRDVSRAQQMGQFEQGLKKEQFGWQQGEAGTERDFRAAQAEADRSFRAQQAEADDQRRAEMNAQMLKEQSPSAQKWRSLQDTRRAIEENKPNMASGGYETAIENLQRQEADFLGSHKQPTPEERKQQLQTKFDTESIDMGNGTRGFTAKMESSTR